MDEPIKQETILGNTESPIRVACSSCDRETRHSILAETRSQWCTNCGGGHSVDSWLSNQIVQCMGCLTISFREVSSCSEDWDFDEDTGSSFLNETVKLFPNRISGRAQMSGAYHLPQKVFTIYQETHAALCANLSIMAGFGLRAIAEAVCKDQGIEKGNLENKIDKLAEKGQITAAGAKILHGLRFMGNAAAHEMRAHSTQQIVAAFDVIEHLLQGVYVLPSVADKLPTATKDAAPPPLQPWVEVVPPPPAASAGTVI